MIQLLLFFHILGVIGLSIGIAIETIILAGVRRASTLAEMRAATHHVPLVAPLMIPSVLLILVMGIALVYAGGFGWSQGWINLVLLVVVAFAVFAPIVIGRRLEGIHAAVAGSENGPVPAAIEAERCSIALNYTVYLGMLEVLAALYVMISKPGLSETVAILIFAALVATIPAAFLWRRTAAAE